MTAATSLSIRHDGDCPDRADADSCWRKRSSYVYFILELAGAVVAIWLSAPQRPLYKLVWMCLLLALPVSRYDSFLLVGREPSGQKA